MKKLLIVASFFLAISGVFFAYALAADVTVSGDAWSDQYGWISFSGPTYGVKVDPGTDLLKGQAWSDKLGWITFDAAGTNANGDLTGCPTAPCQASIDLNNGKVTGWAKIQSLGQWIHLYPSTGSAYGVIYDKNSLKFSGEAWSDYAGWISFRHDPDYGVKTDAAIFSQKILAPTLNSATPLSQTSIRLDWTNNDTIQNGNALERSLTGTGGWATTTQNIAPQATTYTDTGLTKGVTYYYRMMATSPSGSSAYSNVVSATTLTTTTINVTVSPSTAGWTLSNDQDLSQNVHMTGNQTVTVSAPATFTISGDVVSGYLWPPDSSCDRGDGSGVVSPCSNMYLSGGETASFILSYTRDCINGTCGNPNYSLSPASQSLSIAKAAGITVYGNAVISSNFISGATGPISLNVVGSLPAGVTVSYVPRSCSPSCSTTVQFGVDPTAVVGTYTVNFAGSPPPNGSGSNSSSVTLHILPSSGVIVNCSANPNQVDVNENVTWSVTHKEGGTAPYVSTDWLDEDNGNAIVASGDSFTTSYATTGTRHLKARVIDSAGNAGYCSTQAGVGTNPGFEEF